ncbi:hypothetical protein NDN08_008184 [Rhodosorus marinus]|uniref:Transmembrane protein n=1 Tax=Rhodosorus marinus TaxID=101924 RepID=A0AAV8UZR6_9RHOD|nr:hypothetical protein NDN08_008184 [Rhodosorus marinus]
MSGEEAPLLTSGGDGIGSDLESRRKKVGWLGRMCRFCGHYCFRMYSNILMLACLIAFEIFEVFAFYDVGVLNWYPFIVNMCAFPAVIATGILKECFIQQGTQPNSFRPPASWYCNLAWGLMIGSFAVCAFIPIELRASGVLTSAWMWYSLLGTALLFLSFLLAYFFEAVATKLKEEADEADEVA